MWSQRENILKQQFQAYKRRFIENNLQKTQFQAVYFPWGPSFYFECISIGNMAPIFCYLLIV